MAVKLNEVILLEKIDGLGTIGDVVSVRAGYARNALLPQRKAVHADQANLEEIERLKKELAAQEAQLLKEAQERAQAFENQSIALKLNSSEEGQLFGAVKVRDVVDALAEQSLTVESKEVLLPGAIKDVGEHTIQIKLHSEVTVPMQLVIESLNQDVIISAREAEEATAEDVSEDAAEDTASESTDA